MNTSTVKSESRTRANSQPMPTHMISVDDCKLRSLGLTRDAGERETGSHQLRSEATAPNRNAPEIDANRGLARYQVRWKIAMVFDGMTHMPIYHGRTRDLTVCGTAMLTDRDVFSDHPVVILLAIPPTTPNGRHKIVEIRARQIYSVYSGETACFRLGLEFVDFKGSGLEVLKDALSQYRPTFDASLCDPFPTVFGSAQSYKSIQSYVFPPIGA